MPCSTALTMSVRFFSGALTCPGKSLLENRGQLRLEHVLAVVGRVVLGLGPVEPVLLAERDDHLVDQRITESREIWVNGPVLLPVTEIACRSVDAQTPTTAFGRSRGDRLAVRVTSRSGTWSTIDWTA